jgi:hypothetical protein
MGRQPASGPGRVSGVESGGVCGRVDEYLDASAPGGLVCRPDWRVANEYWNDPQPWVRRRLVGRVMSDAERAEEALLEEVYDANGNMREEYRG